MTWPILRLVTPRHEDSPADPGAVDRLLCGDRWRTRRSLSTGLSDQLWMLIFDDFQASCPELIWHWRELYTELRILLSHRERIEPNSCMPTLCTRVSLIHPWRHPQNETENIASENSHELQCPDNSTSKHLLLKPMSSWNGVQMPFNKYNSFSAPQTGFWIPLYVREEKGFLLSHAINDGLELCPLLFLHSAAARSLYLLKALIREYCTNLHKSRVINYLSICLNNGELQVGHLFQMARLSSHRHPWKHISSAWNAFCKHNATDGTDRM